MKRLAVTAVAAAVAALSADGLGDDDARFLQAHGFTAVRLAVFPVAAAPQPRRFDVIPGSHTWAWAGTT